MPKSTKQKSVGKLEVCYFDDKGTAQRVVCDELDRSSIPLGQTGAETLAEALEGFIQTRGSVSRKEVQFMPNRISWVRVKK